MAELLRPDAGRREFMKKSRIEPFDAVAETMNALGSRGALLVAGAEPVNPMTIGWGEIGIAWGSRCSS